MEKEQCKSQIVVSRKHTLCTHRYHGNTQHPCTLKKYYIRKSITTYLKEMYLYTFGLLLHVYVVWDTCASTFWSKQRQQNCTPQQNTRKRKERHNSFHPFDFFEHENT